MYVQKLITLAPREYDKRMRYHTIIDETPPRENQVRRGSQGLPKTHAQPALDRGHRGK